MKITEVRIFPTESKDGKLKAFATMTFDDWFVVRNVKVIQGNNGLFVAMPSRKAMVFCSKCRFKNVIGSKYCNQCGAEIGRQEVANDNTDDKHNNHMDIAHPITQECRVYIQKKILEAYGGQSGSQHSAKRPQPESVETAPSGEDAKKDAEITEQPKPDSSSMIDDSQDIAL